MEYYKGEKIIRESRGNYKPHPLDPMVHYGGRFYLTDTHLYFKGNITNLKSVEETIPLKNIESLEAKHREFISQKISLFLNNNSAIQLIVPKRKEWVQDILETLKAINENEGYSWDEKNILNVRSVIKPKGWLTRIIINILIYAVIFTVVSLFIQWLLSS